MAEPTHPEAQPVCSAMIGAPLQWGPSTLFPTSRESKWRPTNPDKAVSPGPSSYSVIDRETRPSVMNEIGQLRMISVTVPRALDLECPRSLQCGRITRPPAIPVYLETASSALTGFAPHIEQSVFMGY